MHICQYANGAYDTISLEVRKLYLRIRDLREDADLTQQQIADMLNVGQTTYSRYERGAVSIPCEALVALAQFYHTSVDYLLGLTNNRKPYQ